MGKRETFSPFDAAEYLKTDEDMALYLDAIIEESNGDPRMIAVALGDIARAKGMTQIAKATGLARENLYKALSADGNPEFATVMKVITALGIKLHAVPAVAAKPRRASRSKKAGGAVKGSDPFNGSLPDLVRIASCLVEIGWPGRLFKQGKNQRGLKGVTPFIQNSSPGKKPRTGCNESAMPVRSGVGQQIAVSKQFRDDVDI